MLSSMAQEILRCWKRSLAWWRTGRGAWPGGGLVEGPGHARGIKYSLECLITWSNTWIAYLRMAVSGSPVFQHVCVYMHLCVRACVGMWVWVCGYVCVGVWVCVCVCLWGSVHKYR